MKTMSKKRNLPSAGQPSWVYRGATGTTLKSEEGTSTGGGAAALLAVVGVGALLYFLYK